MCLFAERTAPPGRGSRSGQGSPSEVGKRATVGWIGRRLDGIPLAIEPAALRVRAMPVTEILTGLDDHLEFSLATGNCPGPRVLTLRAAID